MSDDGKVVFLAFDNPDAPKSDHELLACKVCRNKTFKARYDLGKWPTLVCCACDQQIGSFGWAEQEAS